MTVNAPSDIDRLRQTILAQPDLILEDRDLMRALVDAGEREMGDNIVDLRGLAMQRLEDRLDRLEDTHRSVIAAAYDNLAGTNQVHRAVLALLEPSSLEAFLRSLGETVAPILRVDALRLVLESHESEATGPLQRLGDVVVVVRPGFCDSYAGTLAGTAQATQHPVTLRPAPAEGAPIYGAAAPAIRSEAVLRLDFGANRLPGLLALGAADPHQFTPSHGTDLLAFLAGVFERQMRRWLD